MSFVTYYTLQDLITIRLNRWPTEAGNPDLEHDAIAGMFELLSMAEHGRVFIDVNCFYSVWRLV